MHGGHLRHLPCNKAAHNSLKKLLQIVHQLQVTVLKRGKSITRQDIPFKKHKFKKTSNNTVRYSRVACNSMWTAFRLKTVQKWPTDSVSAVSASIASRAIASSCGACSALRLLFQNLARQLWLWLSPADIIVLANSLHELSHPFQNVLRRTLKGLAK